MLNIMKKCVSFVHARFWFLFWLATASLLSYCLWVNHEISADWLKAYTYQAAQGNQERTKLIKRYEAELDKQRETIADLRDDVAKLPELEHQIAQRDLQLDAARRVHTATCDELHTELTRTANMLTRLADKLADKLVDPVAPSKSDAEIQEDIKSLGRRFGSAAIDELPKRKAMTKLPDPDF